MPKFVLILLAAAGLIFAATPRASAMISFPDISHPWRIGYHISATEQGTDVHFTVDLNASASAALQKYPPEIYIAQMPPRTDLPAGWPQYLKIKILIQQTPDKRKHLLFTIPKRFLVNCYLRVYSDPIRGDDFIRNVAGYTFILDHVLK